MRNSPIDCIEGLKEVFHERVEKGKTIIVEAVKPIITNTDRSKYPDIRLFDRDIWTEGGRREKKNYCTAKCTMHKYVKPAENRDTSTTSLQTMSTVLGIICRTLCRKGMVTLGPTHKASNCSRRRYTVEWQGNCVHVFALGEPLQGATECLLALEYLQGTCETSLERLAVKRFEGKYT